VELVLYARAVRPQDSDSARQRIPSTRVLTGVAAIMLIACGAALTGTLDGSGSGSAQARALGHSSTDRDAIYTNRDAVYYQHEEVSKEEPPRQHTEEGVKPERKVLPFKTALPRPVLGRTVNIETISGVVFVKLPIAGHVSRAGRPFAGADRLEKGQGFIPLTEARQVPVGSTLDTTGGVVRLTTATASRGKVQSGDFGAGIFIILQRRQQRGLSELRIVDTHSPRQVCATLGKQAGAAKKGLTSKVLGRLDANAHGKFTTRGQYSSATVRGTIWRVTNLCAGTLTHVTRGVVSVRDFVRRKTITLFTGESYLARAP
jgi:hypothetical protein